MSAGLLVLLASLIFIRNAAGVLILLAAVAGTGALIIGVPAVFTGHVAIILGLALLVAAVRDLAKLTNVHLRRRDQLRTSDAYILYRATAVPSAVWIALFSLVVAASWLVAWQPMSRVLAAGDIVWVHEPAQHTEHRSRNTAPGVPTSPAEISTGTQTTSRTGSPGTAKPGLNGEPGWPVERGRYRLIAARACPWANRTVIVRRLLGLEDAISLGQPGPTHDARSWTFDLDPGGKDPVLGIKRLQEAYFRRFPDYPRGITVPAHCRHRQRGRSHQ